MQKAQKKRNQSCLAHFGGVCPKFLNFFSTAHFAPKIRKSVRFSFKTLDLDLPISSWLFFLKFLISFYFVFLFIDFKTSILLESALLNSIGQPLVRLKNERKQRQQQYKIARVTLSVHVELSATQNGRVDADIFSTLLDLNPCHL